jgi:hypothetical protein
VVPVVVPKRVHPVDAGAITAQALDPLRFVLADQEDPAWRRRRSRPS